MPPNLAVLQTIIFRRESLDNIPHCILHAFLLCIVINFPVKALEFRARWDQACHSTEQLRRRASYAIDRVLSTLSRSCYTHTRGSQVGLLGGHRCCNFSLYLLDGR